MSTLSESNTDERLTEREVYRMHREAGYSRVWSAHAAITFSEMPVETEDTQRPSWFVAYEEWLNEQDRRLNDWLDEQIRTLIEKNKKMLGMEVEDE